MEPWVIGTMTTRQVKSGFRYFSGRGGVSALAYAPTRGLRHAVISLATVTLAVGVVSASSASAAPVLPPGKAWKIDKVYPAGEALNNLSPVSARDVWGAGVGAGLLVTRWNGSAWRHISSPAGVTSATMRARSAAIAATSPSNAWLFVSTFAPSTGKQAAVVEHWTGGGWVKSARFPASQSISTAVATSATSVWAFGSSASGTATYAERYNGSTWRRVSFPALVPFQVSAVSASDIWAISRVAATGGIRATIEHWNGSAWRTVGLPRIPLPSGTSPPHYAVPYGIVALGQHDVWAEFGIGAGNPTGDQRIALAHLTAHGWSVLTAPSSLSVYVNYLEHGIGGNAGTGPWLVAARPDKETASLKLVFVHIAGKTWQVVTAPDNVLSDSISAVPGSGDLLALGVHIPITTALPAGVILGYGI